MLAHQELTAKKLLAIKPDEYGYRTLSNGHQVRIVGESISLGPLVKLGHVISIYDKARIAACVTIGDGSIVGEGATVGSRASVTGDSYIKPLAQVLNDAELHNVVVGKGAVVGSYVKLCDVRVPAHARVTGEAFTLKLDWGMALVTQMQRGGWRICVGCRCFTYRQAEQHWSSREYDRPITRRALPYIYSEAVARGWEKPKKGK